MQNKNEKKYIICPLCGFEFDAEINKAKCNCPMASGGCEFICCPRCHYKMPDEPKSIKFIKKIFRK